MHIEDLVTNAHHAAVRKGFKTYDEKRSVAEHVALMMTELGELFEAHRDGLRPDQTLYEYQHRSAPTEMPEMEGPRGNMVLGKPIGIGPELADLVIRAADFAGEHDIDLEQVIREKMAYNETRPHKHGRQS